MLWWPLRVLKRIISRFFLLFVGVLVLVYLNNKPPDSKKVAVHVTDGDSLKSADYNIRIFGIDAPELHQKCKDAKNHQYACGRKSKEYLAALLGTDSPFCTTVEVDRYGRNIAHCKVAKTDLGEAMVRAGWAIAYLRYSRDYAKAETEARKAKRGIWQGDFTIPEQWRRDHPH